MRSGPRHAITGATSVDLPGMDNPIIFILIVILIILVIVAVVRRL